MAAHAEPNKASPPPQVLESLRKDHGLYIDGRATPAHSGRWLDVFDPATEEQLARVPDADAEDVDRAVQSASRAFEKGSWRNLRPADRERILLAFTDLVARHGDELAAIETLNTGKSNHLAHMLDVGASVEFMRYTAGLATKITGETLDVSIPFPPGTKYTAFTRREPIGVVAGITPWNFPMMIALWKAMPALACGCSIVLKPSEVTPLSTLRLAQLATEAGIPDGVLNVVTGRGETAGAKLVAHPLVRKISITGSTRAGKAVGHAAVEKMTRFTFELGGKNPAIFFDDIDVPHAVHGVMMAAFLNQGQVCAAASRLYVQERIYEQFVSMMASAASEMKLGSGFDPTAQVNPLVSRMHREHVAGYVELARKEGAQVVAGGWVPEQKGYYHAPTVLAQANNRMQHAREEIFGPVVSVIPFKEAEEAVLLANDTNYGLAASVWTNDLKRAMNLLPRIEAGIVWVNTHNVLDPHLPFGGYKQSGMGREFGHRAIDNYTEIKSICIAH